MLEYAVRLPDGPARRFFTAAIGLLPGTLTAHVETARLTVHVLDRSLPLATTLQALEDRIADLYGLPPLA